MGDPKHRRRQFDKPRKPWEKQRIEDERKLSDTYGLKNKKEIWRFETILRNKRQNARKLLALPLEERLKREKELLDSLIKIGILRAGATLDDVLSLGINDLMERRLQTIVWRKNLANTPKQARQFITHGHIAVDGQKLDVPSYIVPLEFESGLKYYGNPMILEEKKLAKDAKKPEGEKTKKEQMREDFDEVKKAAEKSEAKPEAKAEKKEEKPAEAKPVEEKKEEKKEEAKEAPKEEKKEEKKEVKEEKPAEEKKEVEVKA
jgi:small subunit ribosomal protein S4